MVRKLQSKVISKKHDEKVMVVARASLFEKDFWSGIQTQDLSKYLKLIVNNHKFMRRGEAEEDPTWKQIIPYLVFENDGKIFVMRRKKDHTDKRLASMYSIGIGGHINKEDIRNIKGVRGNGLIMEWAKREFEEEVEYLGKCETELLGILNYDGRDVGLVHIGLVIKVKGESNNIKIRDEHKEGKLIGVREARKYYKKMETWSQIVYDFLMTKTNKDKKTSTNISGVLPDWLIEKYIKERYIQISPLEKNWKEQIDQVSIDFHLGTDIKLFRGGAYRFIDTRRGLPSDAMEEVNLNEGDPFILEPGAFAITSTREVLKLPRDILGRLEGKSSLARLGILVHSTAARFDPGWNGAPVLELGNLGPKPAILYAGMPICAFTFEKLAASVKTGYEGSRSDRYSGSKVAVASRIERHSSTLRPFEKSHGKQAQGSGQVAKKNRIRR